MEALQRITFNPAIMDDQACIRGKIIQEYPLLEHEDVAQALAYAPRLAREHVFTREVPTAA